jgi:hypothetical protein
VVDRLREWLFGPVPMHWAVVARVGFGLLILVGYLQLLADVPRLFGPQGIGGAESLTAVFGAGSATSLEDALHLRTITSMGLVWTLYVGVLISAGLFTVGAWTRTAGVVMVVLSSLFVARNQAAFAGAPWIFHQWIVYVVLADPGRWVSVDARRRGGDAQVIGASSAWPLRLLQVGVICMYATAGGARVVDPGWLQGSQVFVGLSSATYSRFGFEWFALKPVLIGLNHLTVVLEPAAAVLLWFTPRRRFLVPILIGFHLGLESLMLTGWWQPTMVLGLIAFLPPPWLERGWKKINAG